MGWAGCARSVGLGGETTTTVWWGEISREPFTGTFTETRRLFGGLKYLSSRADENSHISENSRDSLKHLAISREVTAGQLIEGW